MYQDPAKRSTAKYARPRQELYLDCRFPIESTGMHAYNSVAVRWWAVPSYLFHCRDCLKPFTKQLSLGDYEEGGVVCPFCGSDDVEQQLSLFYPVTSKKSA